MKAKELIEILKRVDGEAEVFVCGVNHLPANTNWAEIKDFDGEESKECVCIY